MNVLIVSFNKYLLSTFVVPVISYGLELLFFSKIDIEILEIFKTNTNYTGQNAKFTYPMLSLNYASRVTYTQSTLDLFRNIISVTRIKPKRSKYQCQPMQPFK